MIIFRPKCSSQFLPRWSRYYLEEDKQTPADPLQTCSRLQTSPTDKYQYNVLASLSHWLASLSPTDCPAWRVSRAELSVLSCPPPCLSTASLTQIWQLSLSLSVLAWGRGCVDKTPGCIVFMWCCLRLRLERRMCDVSRWLWEDERGGLSCTGEGGERESSPALTCPAAQSCPSSLLHGTQGWISSQHFTRAGYWLFSITHSGLTVPFSLTDWKCSQLSCNRVRTEILECILYASQQAQTKTANNTNHGLNLHHVPTKDTRNTIGNNK